jgi:hypothetical protein
MPLFGVTKHGMTPLRVWSDPPAFRGRAPLVVARHARAARGGHRWQSRS